MSVSITAGSLGNVYTCRDCRQQVANPFSGHDCPGYVVAHVESEIVAEFRTIPAMKFKERHTSGEHVTTPAERKNSKPGPHQQMIIGDGKTSRIKNEL